MEIHVKLQAAVFLWTVLGGIITSLVYDLFRISRKLFKTPPWVVFVSDLVFWIVCSFLNFAIILEKNSGELRWYLFFGIIIGGVIYFSVLSSLFQKIVFVVLRIFVRLFLLCKKILLVIIRPFLKPVRNMQNRMRKRKLRIKTAKQEFFKNVRLKCKIIRNINRH